MPSNEKYNRSKLLRDKIPYVFSAYKITSFLQQENSEWVEGELQNIKHDYLGRLSANND